MKLYIITSKHEIHSYMEVVAGHQKIHDKKYMCIFKTYISKTLIHDNTKLIHDKTKNIYIKDINTRQY